jgi:Uma2 family endonuclease
MQAKGSATVEDLYHVPGKAELVGGKIVHMTPTGGRHGYASGEIFASLREYARRTGRGYAIGDNIGFVVHLPNRQSFCPDVAFHVGPLSADFIEGAPVFAVEIRSKDDYGPAAEARLAVKRADYFAAGTLVIWDVDIERDGWVRVYRGADSLNPSEYGRSATADAEPALHGWSMSVDDLFPPALI